MTAMNEQAITRIAIAGAAGRMGQRLCDLCQQHPALTLAEAIDLPASPALGQPAPGTAPAPGCAAVITDTYSGGADVMIDFTLPEATAANIARCVETRTALVLGTTGLTDAHQHQLDDAAQTIGVVQATNFSLVVNVLNKLAAQAAQLLGDAYDIEIHEAHHRFKKDAPSGTALTLARAICDATGRDFDRDVVLGRAGDDAQRKPREIAVQALRLGDVVGEHTVHYATIGERMELRHVGTSRDSYATGALHAAQWLAAQPAGRYAMNDVLGL